MRLLITALRYFAHTQSELEFQKLNLAERSSYDAHFAKNFANVVLRICSLEIIEKFYEIHTAGLSYR